jgi:hypothetical protein
LAGQGRNDGGGELCAREAALLVPGKPGCCGFALLPPRQGEQGSNDKDKHKAIVKASHLVTEWAAREGLMVCSRVEWLLHA